MSVAQKASSPNRDVQEIEAELSQKQRDNSFFSKGAWTWLLSKGTWLFVTGGLALGIGTWSVFSTRSAWGSVALVVAGAVLIALWAFGDRILRIRYKGWEVQFASDLLSIASLLEEAGDDENAELLRERANLVIKEPQQKPNETGILSASPTYDVRTAIDYERFVHDHLVALAHEKDWRLTRQAFGFDDLIEHGDRRVVVEMKVPRQSTRFKGRFLQRVEDVRRSIQGFGGAVLILGAQPGTPFVDLLNEFFSGFDDSRTDIRVVTWQTNESFAEVENVLTEMLGDAH